MSESPPITTRIIPARESGWMGRVLAHELNRRWWIAAVIIGGPLAASIFDIRWLLVAIIAALMAWPILLWWAYVGYGLTRDGRKAVADRQITFNPQSLTITYSRGAQTLEQSTVDYTDITSLSFTSSGLCIEWGDGVWQYVKVPHSAFITPDQAKQAVEWMENCALDRNLLPLHNNPNSKP